MKYLFSDVDGTLLKNNNHGIDKSTVKKIQDFIKQGNKFYMASGRTDLDIQTLEKTMNIKCDFRISQNGTVVTDKNDNIVYENLIPAHITLKIKEYLYSLPNIRIEVSTVKERYLDSPRPKAYASEFSTKTIITPNLQDLVGNEIHPSLFLILNSDESVFDEIKTYIKTNFHDTLDAVLTSPGVLEVVNKNCSKGIAIKNIADKFNINHQDIFVVGDNDNDISMFQAFNNSFAMKEAKSNVTNHANFMVNQVGDVIDYINNPQKAFVTTNKFLVQTKNLIIPENSVINSNNFIFISKEEFMQQYPINSNKNIITSVNNINNDKVVATIDNNIENSNIKDTANNTVKGYYINANNIPNDLTKIANYHFIIVDLSLTSLDNSVEIINQLAMKLMLPIIIKIDNSLYDNIEQLCKQQIHAIIINESNENEFIKLNNKLPIIQHNIVKIITS